MLIRFIVVISVLAGAVLLAAVTKAEEPKEIHWLCMLDDSGALYLSGVDEQGKAYTEKKNLGDSVKEWCADNVPLQPGDEIRMNLRPAGKVL